MSVRLIIDRAASILQHRSLEKSSLPNQFDVKDPLQSGIFVMWLDYSREDAILGFDPGTTQPRLDVPGCSVMGVDAVH